MQLESICRFSLGPAWQGGRKSSYVGWNNKQSRTNQALIGVTNQWSGVRRSDKSGAGGGKSNKSGEGDEICNKSGVLCWKCFKSYGSCDHILRSNKSLMCRDGNVTNKYIFNVERL